MKFYVAGPYSDRPGIEKPGDIEEGIQLRFLRDSYPHHTFLRPYDVECPHENPTHAQDMQADCKALLDCDAIVLRPGWSKSKGAMIELNLAVGTGLSVYTYIKGYMYDPEGELS